MSNKLSNTQLFDNIRDVIEQARDRITQTVNSAMVQTYWHIGRLIVEEEQQQGKERAAYGKQQLKTIASDLTQEFGKGFNSRNLRNMRAFYQSFPIWYTLRSKLVWNSLKSICQRRYICLLFYVTQPPRLLTMRNLGGFFMPAARMLNA